MRFGARIAVGFFSALVLVVVVLLGGLSWRGASELLQTVRWVDHAHEVLQRADAAFEDLVDVETGMHGYIITGRTELLEPYERGTERLPGDLTELRALAADSLARLRRVEALGEVSRRTVESAASLVALRASKGFDAAAVPIRLRGGKSIMEEARKQFAAFHTEELRLLGERTTQLTRRSALVFGFVAAFMASLVVLVLAAILIVTARKRAKAEALTRALIEDAPDAFFLADLEGRFTNVNIAACRLLGYSREELIGKTIADIIPPEDVPRLAATRERLLTPGVVETGEWTMRSRDGVLIPVEVSSNILENARWQAFARDIRDRKRIEDERQVFVSLLENSSDFIGIADPSGKPIYVNPAGRRMIGLPADYPVEGTQIPEYYPPEQRSFVADVILKSMIELDRWSGETFFRNWQTEEAIPVSDEHFMIREPKSGRILGMGTVTRDISEARAVNEKLRENEQEFRSLAESMPQIVWATLPNGLNIYFNQQWVEYTGLTLEESRGEGWIIPFHPDDRQRAWDAWQRATQHRDTYSIECRLRRADGQYRWWLIRGVPVLGANGEITKWFGTCTDIEQIKVAEQRLRESEAKFSGIVSISADAIISIDDEQRITIFNEGAERIFGYSKAEVVGASLHLLIPERFRKLHGQHVAAFAAEGVTARRMGERLATIVGLRKNGEEFPAEAAISRLTVGDKSLLTVALRDITRRKRIEKEQQFLAEAGVVLGASLDYEQTLAAVARLIVRDFADWCIVDIMAEHEHLRRLKVVSADPGKTELCAYLEQIPVGLDRPNLLRSVLETREAVLIEHVTSDYLESVAQGPEHLQALRAVSPISIMALPLMGHGQVLGTLAFISSTPARVYGEADLRLAEALADRAAVAIENARLYRASVQATQLRDQVLGVVAHDLRNPLSAILMQAATLRRRGPEPERRSQRQSEIISRAATRMNHLIQDLLDVARMEEGVLPIKRARLAAGELLAEAVDMQRPLAASSSLDIRLEVEHELPDVSADRHRLLQVFENLIGNAMKFTKTGGSIAVGADSRGHDVVFWVADTGLGIAAQDLPHVFDRFWQAKRADRLGAGLGLPITKGIVEAHGGRIWVESTLGQGTTFFFSIPKAHPTADRPTDVIH